MQRYAILMLSVLVILAPFGAANGQTSSVPLSHWAYEITEKWEIQGILTVVFNGSRPYSRIEMAEYVHQALVSYNSHPENFTETDLEYLRYLTVEFREELNRLDTTVEFPDVQPRLERLFRRAPLKNLKSIFYTNSRNLVAIRHENFNFYADPVLAYGQEQKYDPEKGEHELTRWSNGIQFYGNLGGYFGFYFDLTDNHLKDSRWDGQRVPFEVLEESGWPFLTRRQSGKFEFDENIAYITFNYKYFFLTYGREYNRWGTGHSGQFMLSMNAQLYDQIKLIIRYWRFKFTHITAFLQYISPEGRFSIKDQPHTDQYWSGNRLELHLGKGVQLGLQQSVIYGNRSLEPGYVNPLSFYKSVEHYYGDLDNGALGIDAEWRIFPGLKVFGEWFIDDITTTKLGTDWFGNKFGWQVGSYLVNPLFLRDTDILVEYTRVKPYVYSHTVQDYNKYKHYDTILGHFIGPNSDLLTVRLTHRFTKFFQMSLGYDTYRHGSNFRDRNVGGDPDLPFRSGDSQSVRFLDGIRRTQESYGASLQYEFIRNLFAEFHFRRFKSETVDWTSRFSFRISFNFGYRQENIRFIFPATY